MKLIDYGFVGDIDSINIDLLKKYKFLIKDPQNEINPTTFYLSYSEHDNLEIFKAFPCVANLIVINFFSFFSNADLIEFKS